MLDIDGIVGLGAGFTQPMQRGNPSTRPTSARGRRGRRPGVTSDDGAHQVSWTSFYPIASLADWRTQRATSSMDSPSSKRRANTSIENSFVSS